MAETKANQGTARQESGSTIARRDREHRGLERGDPSFGSFGGPFEFMARMSEEMDRWFDRVTRDFGFPRPSWPSRGGFGTSSAARGALWAPRIEALQKGDRYIVRAELPGLKRDDVDVELTDEALSIRGERREEHDEEREGYYRSEREYGRFQRTIPLPPGVITESAQATFRDGVLEVSMQAAPSEANRGRKIDIQDASGERQEQGKQSESQRG
jgi:HSP20 family protein